MPRELPGKVMIITGASSGIGAATAIECARAGMDLVLNARRADRLEQVAERVRSLGRSTLVVAGDVDEPGLADRLLDVAEADLGGFYAVFANAGYGLDRTVVEETQEELRAIFETNFFASADLVRTAARRLRDAGRPGHLLMCSSCLSKFAIPRHGAYSATKAAQNATCAAMRLECREHGIHVSSVHPITTTTEFFDATAARSGLAATGATPNHSPSFFTQRPERVARAIVGCLRKPCPEVWTSTIVRTIAGVMTISPRFGDWMIARQIAKDE